MIQVKHLYLTHKKDLRPLLSDFSFALNPGDKAVIIGEEGNGKSTLLKWLADPALVEGYAEAEGERITGGAKIGYLPQELPEEEKERTLYAFFCEEEQFFQWSPRELSKMAGELGLSVDFHLDTLTAGNEEIWMDGYAGHFQADDAVSGQNRQANEGERTDEAPRILAKNIELLVRGPEKVCIIGKNGVGKTTLLRRIAAELLSRQDIRAAYMPQNYEELLNLDETPVDYLSESGDKEEITKIRTWLGSMKYTADEMNYPVRELSGGQKAKIFLLKMNLSGANVLILDEPTRNFSPLSNPVIRQVLSDFGGAIISISHDRRYIEEVCQTVYELTEEGMLLFTH